MQTVSCVAMNRFRELGITDMKDVGLLNKQRLKPEVVASYLEVGMRHIPSLVYLRNRGIGPKTSGEYIRAGLEPSGADIAYVYDNAISPEIVRLAIVSGIRNDGQAIVEACVK